MQLGGRFDTGTDFSKIAPAAMLEKIAQVEQNLSEDERQTKRWTLTWLEGNPVLTLDDGPKVTVDGLGDA